MIRLLLLTFILISFIACKSDHSHQEETQSHLGDVTMDVTGADKAQPYFKEGLLLLHNFEYDDAAAQFAWARQIDPDFVMAYWGEAMTKNHPLWSAHYAEEGTKILSELAPTTEERLAKAKTIFERDMLKGVEILFSDLEKAERDMAYSEYMGKLNKKYPENHEVAAFYALSLLGSVSDRDPAVYGRGAKIVENILKENPKHPGALHYMIHSYDDPDHAHLALNAANDYSKVASDAGHALHMPSHIFIALGMWDEVIASNIASFEASKNRKEEKELGNDALGYHAMHWLTYGYLQKNDREKARELIQQMQEYTAESTSPRSRAYRVSMLASYLVDTDDWDDPVAKVETDVSDLNVAITSTADFMTGMHAYKAKDLKGLAAAIKSINDNRTESELEIITKGGAMCSGVGWASQLPSQADMNHAEIMEMELSALLADLNGDDEKVQEFLEKATAVEDETSFMFGPPIVSKPSHELYGEWLLDHSQFEKAAEQFKNALERAPKRRLSVEGLERVQNSI